MDECCNSTSCKQLEQFLLLAKTAKGQAAVELITRALEAPGVYVFGELLDSPNIKELSSGVHSQHYQLLELFTFGTFADYAANVSALPVLSIAMTTKLKQLTLVTMASQCRTLSYSTLLQSLSLENVRQLEDLIIDAVYCGIITGRLDQENKVVASMKAILTPATSGSSGTCEQIQEQSYDMKQPAMKKGLRGSARLFKS
ncbi:COP9 signalosome complex subunit 7b-like isoform X2 [Dysidea avara]|uniref:COP9 signalosome complex subunit 7b-like isoform X2 n=1 Tax=Dysidea avara TaxID=196820 RepID=UPI0033236A36